MDAYQIEPHHIIKDEAHLRKLIAPYPKVLDKRILSELDKYCIEFMEHAKLAVIGFSLGDLNMDVLDTQNISIRTPKSLIISSNLYLTSCQASLYYLIPGVGHGLRVHGIITPIEAEQNQFKFTIERVYLHCARAAARSELWQTKPFLYQDKIPQISQPKSFIEHSSYALIKTLNVNSETELSPRGDAAGFIQWLDEHTLFMPERPGNKVAISLRNILENPSIELLCFIPGCSQLLCIKAQASLTTQPDMLSKASIQNKQPKLGILLRHCQFSFQTNYALHQVQPWLPANQSASTAITKFSKALSIHMNGEGLLGQLTKPVVGAIVSHDMKNLY